MLARILLALFGSAISTFFYAVTIRADIGLGPLFAVQEGLSNHTGLSIGTIVIIVGLAMLAMATALGERPGASTIGLPFVTGPMLDRILEHLGPIHGIVPRYASVLAASSLMCLGGALVIRAALGANAIDGIMIGLGNLTKWNLRRVRLCMEATMLMLGFLLGGTIGAGTVITGLLVGPSMHFWLHLVDRKDEDDIHVVV